MSTGSVQQVVVCVPKSPNNGNSVTPCVTVGTTRYTPTIVSAYLFDSDPNIANLTQVVPFDYQHSGAAFAFGLTMVLTFWLAAKPIGLLLELVKKG